MGELAKFDKTKVRKIFKWASITLLVGFTLYYLLLVGSGFSTWSALNPFRSRAPEKLAEELLTQIQNGKCIEALEKYGLASEKCETFGRHPLADFWLIEREKSEDGDLLRYGESSSPPIGMSGSELGLRIVVISTSNGYRISDFRTTR